MKNIRLWIAAAVIMLVLLCVGAASAETIASGNCGAEGDNVTWTLDSEGVLSITGTGAMKDYGYDQGSFSPTTPWTQHMDKIKSAIISGGVTSIGDYVFADCSSLTSIIISNSVTSIGEGVFYDCSSLTSIVIP
ncbi:MAG: leucine-rich repeat domain-containing protein, partial [Clostridia bacterium]|nr:leucine-rich repeat domain-containing protein [Clostridia bacterium]